MAILRSRYINRSSNAIFMFSNLAFSGLIDYVRIYDIELTVEDIAALEQYVTTKRY
jgi:hypothetical protein